jgi:small neutral amino acid transporter SnatA (MarC family)
VNLAEYILLAISSLFVIIDPLALVPLFLATTPRDTLAQRIKTAGMAGSVVLYLIAFDMLRAQRSPVQETAAETDEKEHGWLLEGARAAVATHALVRAGQVYAPLAGLPRRWVVGSTPSLDAVLRALRTAA